MNNQPKRLRGRRGSDAKTEDTWVKAFWRPMMAWQYFVICLFDFMIAPIGRALLAVYTHTDMNAFAQWQPLTLQGGGLYHLAMGAIIGISSYSRGQEKITYQQTTTQFDNEHMPQSPITQRPPQPRSVQTTTISKPENDPEL